MTSSLPSERGQAPVVVFSAPQGYGKTARAPSLAAKYGCHAIVDDWWPGEPLWPDTLHLTSATAHEIRRRLPPGAQLVTEGWQS